jgi:Ca-activated chloride channel family protein
MHILLAVLVGVVSSVLQEHPRLQVEVNLVNVSFTVHDAQGRFVPHLTADDFEVFEDGDAQKIQFFARSANLPLSVGLVVDFSGSQEHFFKAHHRDLEEFLNDVLGPRDRAFLLCFGNHLRLVQDFTSSTRDLMEGLKDFEHDKQHYPELGPPDEERELGTGFYDAIYYPIMEKMAGPSSGQKALLVFSDGEDNSSAHHMLDAIEAAQNENVRVYGLRYTESPHGHLTARNKYGISVMGRIARDTGAADYDARKGDLAEWLRQIGEELRSSYDMAYPSTHPVRDGSFRKITVRAKRAGLLVRAKPGYFAEPSP